MPHISTALDQNSGTGDIYSDQFGEHSYQLRFVCFAAVQEHPIFLVDTAGISMRFSDDVPGAREALPQNRGRPVKLLLASYKIAYWRVNCSSPSLDMTFSMEFQ